jgi:D-beta-D-heptose 7-phosphate kinase/D-beta-D-heptose 1-phosphate adenosyltransferase
MNLSALQPLLQAVVHDARVVCVGDLMIDRYVYGDVTRISPEAPIPVMLKTSEQSMLGGVGNVASNVVRAIQYAADDAGAILLSDYAKGSVTPAVVEACLRAARANNACLIVDAKAHSLAKYGPADLIKPNALELSILSRLPTETDAEVEAALLKVLGECEAKAILVTRGAKGMSLARRGETIQHIHGVPRRVFDVSGAGDTGLAALGLAMAAKAELADAAAFAVLASGVAVSKVGTAVVTPAELIDAELAADLGAAEAKIVTLEQARAEAERWRAQGLKVGFTNGCFDILHRGHMAYLTQARAWCDRLVVGLNSDASVKTLKGEGRPVNDLDSRALVLAGMSHVDLVTPFAEATPLNLIQAIRPDFLIKGADYTVDSIVGADFVQSYGGEVRLADLVDGYSTTAAIARIKDSERSPEDA